MQQAYTVKDIAGLLNAQFEGDERVKVQRPCTPSAVNSETDLAVAMSKEYLDDLKKSSAVAAILPEGTNWQDFGLKAAVFVPRARRAMADLTSAFNQPIACYNGVHSTAYVDPSATIHPTARINPFVFIGADVIVEENAIIHSHVSIEQGARIGAGSDIRSGVRITRNVKVGRYALLHENCVIGGDGFSFVTPDVGSAETAKQEGVVRADARNIEILKIYSLGAVTLGDYVEVGACTSIDRGTLTDTIIGNGTKIDSSVQIGHNVKIGENCMVCGHVGIAGSAIIGDRCILAGKVGIADHVEIKHDSVIGAASNVATNVPAHSVMFGTPAIPKKDAIQTIMGLRRLPRLIKAIEELRDKVSLLERK